MAIGRLLISLCLAFLFLNVIGRAEAPKRPNVLWICGDDHAPYVYGAYGNTQVRTPNLDRLAAQGMRFDRAYCASPVCTASRAAFITGRYPHAVGVTLLRTPLPESERTLAEMLKEAGYATAAIGKMHFNSELKHGFDVRLDLPQYQAALKERGPRPLPPGAQVLPPWRPFQDPARIWLNGFYRPYGATDADMDATYFAREAEKIMKETGDRPYFLMLSFTEPHSPFHYPVEYAGRHDPKTFTVPKVGPEDGGQIPEIFRNLTDVEKQGIIAAYVTSVEYLDAKVGAVLDALERSGKGAETIVIYTGDHGYMLGQHGRFEKHCSFEPAVRSPLVIRFPRRVAGGSSTDALTEFVDIVPTVLEFCGIAIPASVQGRSLAPLLTGKTTRHRDAAISEYLENEEAMIRTEKWKLVYITGKRERKDGYATGRPLPGRTVRLYDMENDPDEMTNLAGKPEHAAVVKELSRRLADHMVRTARDRAILPRSDDPYVLLDFCLQPRDAITR